MHIQTHPYHYGVLWCSLFLLSKSTNAQETPPSPTYDYNPPMATVLIVLIALLFTVGFISVYLRHFIVCLGINLSRAPIDVDNWARQIRRQGLDPAAVDSFPTFLYSDVKVHRIGKSSLECAICLNEFANHEMLRLLPPCSHVFHPQCICPWLESHVTCPVCRANLESRNDNRTLSFDSFIVPQQLDHHQVPENESEPPSNPISARGSPVAMKSPELQEMKGVGVRVGSFPRSHSTGHSLIEDCDDRYTLRLPEEVRSKLVNFNNLSGLPAAIVSPRIGHRSTTVGCAAIPGIKPDHWWFSVSPPFIVRPESATGSDHDNSVSSPVRMFSGPRNMLKSIKSPLNRVVQSNDIGERSSDKLWFNGLAHDVDLEGQLE